MTFDFAFAMKVFAAMFAIMNPIANIPVFLSLTEGATEAEKQRVALVSLIGVVIGCVVSVSLGGTILRLFGVTIDGFRLAGGLLVLLIALNMLHGTASAQHHPKEKEMSPTAAPSSVAIYPLTIPLLVGPGTISTLIVFGHTAETESKLASLTIGLAAFLLVLAITLLSAPFLAKYLSARAIAITQRLMGMILAAIAMEMMVSSLQAFFK
jgi:multiple antibiotic resistance protein